jgi:hypothetical protein
MSDLILTSNGRDGEAVRDSAVRYFVLGGAGAVF